VSFPFGGRSYVTDLDTPLLELAPGCYHRARDAAAGVAAFGGIGHGKTSGLAVLAASYLRAGMGGLVLCAKPEEVEHWRALAQANGRSRSVVIFDETRQFNPIAWELSRHGMRGIGAVVACLMRILETADIATDAGSGREGDAFWGQSIRACLHAALPLLHYAWGNVTIAQVVDFVTSAATSAEQYTDPSHAAFQRRSLAARTLRKAANSPAVPMSEHELRPFFSYWMHEYPAIPEKTRGNIVISLSSKLDRFRHGVMARCFASNTDIVPEMMFHGAIIVMALPVLTMNEDALIAQQIFKFMAQRAVESRNGLPPEHRDRLVFLWADEAQYFVNVKDAEFLSTCRGSRACVVLITQTLPAYYARLGKDRTDAVDDLVGKCSTQVFFGNACNRTNKYASDLLGRSIHFRQTLGTSSGSNTSHGMSEGENSSWGTATNNGTSSGFSSGGGSYSHNAGTSSNSGGGDNQGMTVGRGTNSGRSWSSAEQMDNIIEPNFFATGLKAGGPLHKQLVTALWFRAGARYAAAGSGNYLIATFKQGKTR
jgi:type IV secretory pathway TraG/TraD family ATPase VirD4